MNNDEKIEKTKDEYNINYEKPKSHKNFWKTFGLNNNAGKLLYQLYGEKKDKITKFIKLKKKEKNIEEIKQEEIEKEKQEELKKKKLLINYPTFKKKDEKKNVKISRRKPLTKILEDTKNYELNQDIPVHIETSREEEKKKLADIFFQQTCKMVPAEVSSIKLSEEEIKEILEIANERKLKLNGINKDEKIINEFKNYLNELKIELQQKNNLMKHLDNKNIHNLNDKEYQKYNNEKMLLRNEIEQCKKNINKTENILKSL